MKSELDIKREYVVNFFFKKKKELGLSYEWSFGWLTTYSSLGECNHKYKCIRISIPFVEKYSLAEVYDTILHEIAHALVGYEHKHDQVWKAKCREIGAEPKAGKKLKNLFKEK